ncbi:MAG: hypothetical protein ACRC62_00065 [Microcoleus sp.]
MPPPKRYVIEVTIDPSSCIRLHPCSAFLLLTCSGEKAGCDKIQTISIAGCASDRVKCEVVLKP